MRLILSVLITLGSVSICSAVPVILIHEGAGSGTLDGVPFGNTAFVITAQGNTSNRTAPSVDVFSIIHDSAQIQLTGLGTFSFTSPTRTFVNQSSPIVGFSRGSSSGTDLFNGPTNGLFSTWDMLSSIGPIAGSGRLLQWSSPAVTTNGGVLVFNDGTPTATFTARLVPEPSAYWLTLVSMIIGSFYYCRANRVVRRSEA
jgi:hypothetical protein